MQTEADFDLQDYLDRAKQQIRGLQHLHPVKSKTQGREKSPCKIVGDGLVEPMQGGGRQGACQAPHLPSPSQCRPCLLPPPTGACSLLQDLIIFLLSQLGNARASLAAAQVEALEAAKVVSDVAAGLRSKGVRL